MKSIHFHRALIYLYPENFRRQFSEEMISVFERRAGERFVNRKSVSVAFLLSEFCGIVRGASSMWLANLLSGSQESSVSNEVDSIAEPVSIVEVTRQRETAIKNMVAAITRHDFSQARHYSYQEAHLNRRAQEMQDSGRPVSLQTD
jgi:hypothetical protein